MAVTAVATGSVAGRSVGWSSVADGGVLAGGGGADGVADVDQAGDVAAQGGDGEAGPAGVAGELLHGGRGGVNLIRVAPIRGATPVDLDWVQVAQA